MKALVYYCRWQSASLRLRGREDGLVWGHLVFLEEDNSERLQAFRFYLKTNQLVLVEGDEEREVQLDEMGVVQK